MRTAKTLRRKRSPSSRKKRVGRAKSLQLFVNESSFVRGSGRSGDETSVLQNLPRCEGNVFVTCEHVAL